MTCIEGRSAEYFLVVEDDLQRGEEYRVFCLLDTVSYLWFL